MATFTNQATLTYNGNTVNSNTVTGNITEVLTLTKTALVNTYTTGDSVTYVLSLNNSGLTPITGATVTDNLGSYAFNTTTLTPLDYFSFSYITCKSWYLFSIFKDFLFDKICCQIQQ